MAEASLELLVRLFLPEDILEYFEVIHIDHDAKEIRIHLEELNIPPKEYADNKLISKGFLPESSVQDFPVDIPDYPDPTFGLFRRGENVTYFPQKRIKKRPNDRYFGRY